MLRTNVATPVSGGVRLQAASLARIYLFLDFPLPQAAHFGADFEQFRQAALGFDPAVFHHQDVVGAVQRGAAVRDHQAGHPAALCAKRVEALPQAAFGLDVQRAGQVVKNQQFRVAYEHARGCRALHLPA